jgi:hypothetical protein
MIFFVGFERVENVGSLIHKTIDFINSFSIFLLVIDLTHGGLLIYYSTIRLKIRLILIRQNSANIKSVIWTYVIP